MYKVYERPLSFHSLNYTRYHKEVFCPRKLITCIYIFSFAWSYIKNFCVFVFFIVLSNISYWTASYCLKVSDKRNSPIFPFRILWPFGMQMFMFAILPQIFFQITSCLWKNERNRSITRTLQKMANWSRRLK